MQSFNFAVTPGKREVEQCGKAKTIATVCKKLAVLLSFEMFTSKMRTRSAIGCQSKATLVMMMIKWQQDGHSLLSV